MARKTILCDCPHPHHLPEGTEVRVEGEGDQPFFISFGCTRGLSGRDYTELTWMLADPRKVDEPGWPIHWAHHSLVRVAAQSATAPSSPSDGQEGPSVGCDPSASTPSDRLSGYADSPLRDDGAAAKRR